MGNVTLVPEGNVFEGGDGVPPDQARQARKVFRQHRVPLVGHRRRPFLPLAEEFLRFENLGPLQMADFDGELFDGRGDNGQGGEELGMPVALHHLGRAGGRPQSRLFTDEFFDERVDIGEGANCARDLAIGDGLAGCLHPASVTLHLIVPQRHLQTEGDGLRMDAVGAADHRREPMLVRPFLDHRHQPVDIIDDHVGCFSQQHGKGGIENI